MNSSDDRRLMVTCQAQSGSVPIPGNEGQPRVTLRRHRLSLYLLELCKRLKSVKLYNHGEGP